MSKRFYWVLSVMTVFVILSITAVTQASQLKNAFRIGDTVFPNQAAFIASGARCGTRVPSGKELRMIQPQLDALGFERMSSSARTYNIPVAFHVITNGSVGNVSDQDINQQIQVLNQAYASAGFAFSLASITRTANATWFRMLPGTNAELQAKTNLGVSPQTTLNLYTANPSAGLLGWATFPWELSTNPTLDGVVLLYSSLPNGASAPYNLGDTAVHEVGHWLGLLHTFSAVSSCSASDALTSCTTFGNESDCVVDTPAEKDPAFGCPINRDTCTNRLGYDPVTNYMDYSDDSCMTGFTAGQIRRLQRVVEQYRTQL